MRARWIVQQITHNWKNEEDMTRKLTTLFAAAAVLGGVAAATTVFGNETAPSPQPPRTEGATGGMMGQVSPIM